MKSEGRLRGNRLRVGNWPYVAASDAAVGGCNLSEHCGVVSVGRYV